MEYKYVIRGPNGDVTWKPGNNYNIPLPEQEPASWLQTAIAIRDAWDESFRCIQVMFTGTSHVLRFRDPILESEQIAYDMDDAVLAWMDGSRRSTQAYVS